MTINVSTGLRAALLGANPFKTALAPFFVDLYSGTQPESADSAPIGTLLMTVSVGHDGVTGGQWGNVAGGVLPLAANQVLQGVGLVAGSAGWFRFRLAGDGNDASTLALRMDGAIASFGADLDMADTTVAVGQVRTLDAFQVTVDAVGA